MSDKLPPSLARLADDVRRLAKHAVALGAILAVVCHLIPPQYRAICETLRSLCGESE